jgi:predicted DNA-binding transcriptional regulator YafY
MGRTRRQSGPPAVTAGRAGRLYKLLLQVRRTARPRDALRKKLKVDLRGFYRDLELLRELGIEITSEGDRYRLTGELDDALARLPFPDPGLSLRDALQLAQGRSDVHRKLRARITAFLGSKAPLPLG